MENLLHMVTFTGGVVLAMNANSVNMNCHQQTLYNYAWHLRHFKKKNQLNSNQDLLNQFIFSQLSNPFGKKLQPYNLRQINLNKISGPMKPYGTVNGKIHNCSSILHFQRQIRNKNI